MPAFSFSISWPRIFPFGKGPINEEGVKHYDDVIAELVEQDFKIAPVLFHWDTPLALFNEYGAWSDRQIVDDFFDYATFIIQRYDHLVDEWFVSTPLQQHRDYVAKASSLEPLSGADPREHRG